MWMIGAVWLAGTLLLAGGPALWSPGEPAPYLEEPGKTREIMRQDAPAGTNNLAQGT